TSSHTTLQSHQLTRFSSQYVHHMYVQHFPTRRSSDLGSGTTHFNHSKVNAKKRHFERFFNIFNVAFNTIFIYFYKFIQAKAKQRSEEHTSELQSRFDIVCRLLLEKKKTQKK